ncbi:MAG: cell filamentation protein Fic, partial [Bacteroidaceae bacterium]|nr:cell filamentation protein Fic [Bacteroidaceae bacterium]
WISKQDPTSNRHAPDKLPTPSPAILSLVNTLGKQQLSIKDMLSAMNLKDRENFMENYLSPAIKDGFIVMLYPDNPKHPGQKYLLTTKGLSIYNSKS